MHDLSINIGSETIKPVSCARDLGFHFDDELSMKQHINTIARTCFYHLPRLRQSRRRAGREVTVRLVLALVMSRIDFCNALFAGLPTSTIAPLQRVQNAADRLVLQLGPRDHVSQGLRELHWLPIHTRVLYKLCVLMYDVHVGNSPSYIRDIVATCRSAAQRSGLRSSSTTDYVKPRLSTKFGERAFSFAGPHAWNQLPHQLRSIVNPAAFKKHLKTHFLNSVFN